uniref:Uncharacterized protein n=1 Tax=Chromera velia CCMP2878 TaxID=1169474 RepID=A0A0G4IFS6_9ALVE|eukprot:Cvel_14068.t1-p1 / transcript=Cvel_14068.t1 / gene=Cvel_14068 / organism=Chromera_velia_CCMP2878 / gene_product=L-xylulose reductase, putative / transcript_product=L-xylulose reductase, putative / location=Cvel_scaffold987:37317-40870(+) / protein_length=245 / sequence_SO=supercontig / SO=protein_coding / is_pseudo=false
MRFQGKKAIVTGAGKGLGRDLVKVLRAEGAEVAAVSRTETDLQSLAKEVPGISTCCVDLSDVKALQECVQSIGCVDFLVNNAGIAICKPFLELTAEDFGKTLDVNLTAAFVATQAAAKLMKAEGRKGVIVNVSSQVSKTAVPLHAAYCASKAGLDMLTQSSALELGPFGIRCCSVAPTVVMTDMGRANWSGEAGKPMLNAIPLGKFAEVEDVTNVVLFLLSEQAQMLTGLSVPIDGGFLACKTLK